MRTACWSGSTTTGAESAGRHYRDGKRDGLYESYDEEGRLKTRGAFKNGVVAGPYELYDADGQVREIGTFKDGAAS